MSQTSAKLAIHVDGGTTVGLGHATRGIGLAEACKSLGFTVMFLIDPASGLKDFLSNRRQEVHVCEATPLGVLQAAQSIGASALVIDSYRFDEAALRLLQNQGLLIICFDDQANRALPVDVVINGSPAAPSLTYDVGPDTHLLLDVAYQVVRPEFWPHVPRDYDTLVRSLFVSIGGSDLLGIFDPLIKFLDHHATSLLANVTIDFVLGHFGTAGDRPLAANLRIQHSPKDMRSLMVKADLAISAGGQTLYELARCGTPTIAFCVGADQIPNLTALEQRGCIVNIGWASQPNWLDKLHQVLQQLLVNPNQRAVLGKASSNLIDGKGATRIAKAIQSLI
ncbi:MULTISPECIES: glycosyltransferase [unclassified Moorena]|uniref:PseG/SpsG family protein n=1 Tax=unclassified Moorena TaxID=2683338 RepID=UPI0013FF16A6|nr:MULTISPECIES: glycosyltransferase [unclassified Moorena]NEO12172.1 hypothetical protein [Moorena sp. SIO3E8]NEQ00914.1 hypothetical protein [Moorena sp. SIO3F7]